MASFRVAIRPYALRVPTQLSLRAVWRPFSGAAFGDRDLDIPDKCKLQVLAIETSCDDTSVALLRLEEFYGRGHEDHSIISKILFHKRLTSDSAKYGGIHPLVALNSHQRNLGPLVRQALKCVERQGFYTDHDGHMRGTDENAKPDLIAVTRGPGMRSNLSEGLALAKGLASSFNVPLIGVHHMQAHALTPRLNSVLKKDGDDWKPDDIAPEFPFLTVLASGGHTMLLSSESLTEHKTLAETTDIALGDFLDKAARAIVPIGYLKAPYGKALEDFAFDRDSDGTEDFSYTAPKNRGEELERKENEWGWSLGPPLADSNGREKSSRRMMYSFAGLLNTVEKLMEGPAGFERSIYERKFLARETMRVAFEHLASRIFIHLQDLPSEHLEEIDTIVVSGGVAANKFLRHVLRSSLNARGYEDIDLEFPPPELCTDNALMIAWAGLEMYDAGYKNELDIQPIRKWSVDPDAADGGVLGPENVAREAKQKEQEPEQEGEEGEAKSSIGDKIVNTWEFLSGLFWTVVIGFCGYFLLFRAEWRTSTSSEATGTESSWFSRGKSPKEPEMSAWQALLRYVGLCFCSFGLLALLSLASRT